MLRCKGRLLVLAWSVLALIPARAPAQVLAYIGTDSITIEDFSRRYRGYRQQSVQGDSPQTSFDFLHRLIDEAIYTQYGRDKGLDQDPNILRAGQLAWREALLHGVARGHFVDDVILSADEVEAEYRYRNTVLLTRYLTLRDSLTAAEYLQKLKAGEPFESLALQASIPAKLLDRPDGSGQTGWKFPHQLDSSYARHAYRLAPGQLSEPLRTAQGCHVIQLLGKEFRPDHGHFERVVRQQVIAAELRPLKVMDRAREALQQQSTALPIDWRILAVWKVLRSRILEDPDITSTADSKTAELADEVLFTLYDEPYTLDWLLARLDLLLPEERAGIASVKALRELIRRLLIWDQIMELAASLPQADSLIMAADSRQQAVVHRAVQDSVQARILGQAVPPEDSLRRSLARQQGRYATPALVNLEEIVVRDSTLAAALRDSLVGGYLDFSALARRHTEREWARKTGGRLGWVPLRIYGPAAGALIEAAGRSPERLVGPLKVDGYYVLAQPSGYQPARVAPFSTLQPRLRRDWRAANRQRLIREWMQQLQATTYPVTVDTSLVARLRLDEMGRVTFTARPDSTGPRLKLSDPD